MLKLLHYCGVYLKSFLFDVHAYLIHCYITVCNVINKDNCFIRQTDCVLLTLVGQTKNRLPGWGNVGK